MQRIHLVSFAVAFLCLPLALTAQQEASQLQMTDKISFTQPDRWVLGAHSRDSMQLHVPAEETVTWPGTESDNPKPLAMVQARAGLLITVEHRRDHDEAVRRLAEIASEQPEPAEFLVIGGWPAVEITYRDYMPVTGKMDMSPEELETEFSTTAIAVDDVVLRYQAMVAPGESPELLQDVREMAYTQRAPEGSAEVARKNLESIRRLMAERPKPPPRAPRSQPAAAAASTATREAAAGVAVNVQNGVGELEVATNDGQHVVVAANSGYSFSSDFGATFNFGGGTPCNQVLCDGDPSLAVGQSGDIYYAWIGGPTNTSLGNGVSRSTDDGQTFQFRGLAATCPGITACSVADQEHIAADRDNAGASGDQLYNVWRDFAPTFSLRISCSNDSGATWTAGTAIAAGDFPRVSVGGDGFVYVAYASGGNMMLHKYSDCDSGLNPQVGWPVTVSAFNTVVCPVPGLDRCNFRNILSSPKVAVDDVDPNHVYYVFATSTGAGNEDVMVFDSNDGGATFPRSVRVNGAVAARRFMPWISSYGGVAMVSWYDRRTATPANNDRTRFYLGGAAVRGPNLEALAEVDLSGNDDPQCTNWPCATDFTVDSESCSAQPQLAGRCSISGIPCDFSTPACPAGETCNAGRGCPKYGDYNGNAAGWGRFFTGWASTTPPAAIGGGGGTLRVYSSADLVPSDFYVRDWNASPDFDNGAQPSTSAVFWATSDVWNQSTTTPAAPAPSGAIVGDPPSRSGSNYLFARVSRRAHAASTAPDATVTVNFYRGDFGLGSPFVDVGSETLTFTAGDTSLITPAHAWTVPATASAHLCVAVQIEGPDGDDFALPSIVGTAPGPADPLIVIDNNKAQRNLADTVGTAGGFEFISQVRNISPQPRVVRLRARFTDEGLRGRFSVVGGRTFEMQENEATLDLGTLRQGEVRWLRFRADHVPAIDRPAMLHVFEDDDPPSNGFSLLVRRAELSEVVERNLRDARDVLARLSELRKTRGADKRLRKAEWWLKKLRRHQGASVLRPYRWYLRKESKRLGKLIDRHLEETDPSDLFNLRQAHADLLRAVRSKDHEAAALAHRALIERLDAQLSQLVIRGQQN